MRMNDIQQTPGMTGQNYILSGTEKKGDNKNVKSINASGLADVLDPVGAKRGSGVNISDVYVSLTGDQCALTNIRIIND